MQSLCLFHGNQIIGLSLTMVYDRIENIELNAISLVALKLLLSREYISLQIETQLVDSFMHDSEQQIRICNP